MKDVVKVRVKLEYLSELIGEKVKINEAIKLLSLIRCNVISKKNNRLLVEVPYERADLYSAEGAARALLSLKGREIDLGGRVEKGNYMISAREAGRAVQPYIGGAVIEGWRISDESRIQVEQLISNLQKYYCGKRRRAFIEIHDLSNIQFPLSYTLMKKRDIKFKPRNKGEEMNGEEMLKELRMEHFFAGLEEYPVIIDAGGKFISMPPITGSDETKLPCESSVRRLNLMIIMTAETRKLLERILKVVCANMLQNAEKAFQMEVAYRENVHLTPNVNCRSINTSFHEILKIIGSKIDEMIVLNGLRRAGFKVKKREGEIEIAIPFYRIDARNIYDVIDDALSIMGYDMLIQDELEITVSKIGRPLNKEVILDRLRDLMVGFGFKEVLTSLFLKEKNRLGGELIEISNPSLLEYRFLRNTIIPNLLEVLRENRHLKKPIKIFEIGETYEGNPQRGYVKNYTLTGVFMYHRTCFERIHGIVDVILKLLNVKYRLSRIRSNYFMDGRAAGIIYRNRRVGVLGEINPEILVKNRLTSPVTGFEIHVNKLMGPRRFELRSRGPIGGLKL